MTHYYWNDWYVAWGWFLWFGVIFLLFSSAGNWRYTYSAHQRHAARGDKGAVDILNERYARGEISREQLGQMKTDIGKP